MKVSRNEMIRIRMNLLKQFDLFIKDHVSEDNMDAWFIYGLEDNWDEEILREYASDDGLWNSCIWALGHCCGLEGLLQF